MSLPACAPCRRRLDDPRLDLLLAWRWQVMRLAWRLSNLNRRVVTPAWLAAKYRNLMRGWRARRETRATSVGVRTPDQRLDP
ncbi:MULTISPECIES: hypothetical protein [unclassified Thiocapsa]|uniref:hypothetical protein n=1 Tax=unclassified Thiocapsa TaxID=2641286 RepID=UPI0035B024B4